MADSTPISAGAAPPRSLSEWERITRELLEEGQNFLAHDTAREGLRQYPDSFKLAIFGAVALSQTGAVDEARKLLQPVLDVILIDEGPFHRLHNSLQRAVAALDAPEGQDTLSSMADLAEALELVRGKKLVANADSETYTALAGVFREAWLSSERRGDLEHCRELYLRAFHISNSPRDGIDAAVTSWLLGDHDGARDLARRVRDRVTNAETDLSLSPEERYQLLATVAEAHLLLGEAQDALASFAWASTLEGIHYGSTVAALKQLALLREGGLDVPEAVFDVIKPPTVVVFTGHALDRPGEGPHFPPELEAAVRAEIAKSLDELGAQVGYSTAACGSDLLFIEAMLERGAEVNVVMPYAIDDFIAENVRYGGSRWEMRFRNALKLANTVTYATEERFLGHGMLYRFANQCLHGLATLRANFLRTAPYLLAVWDMMPGSLAGGAADFIDQWEDISRLRIIDLDGLLQQHPELAGDTMPSLPDLETEDLDVVDGGRVIRSMMFCDIAGYSKLKEEHTPVFLDFLRIISEGMARLDHQPLAINTWGDAIFAVMDKATPMAEYAQTLQEMVLKADEELADRLPHPLSLRISLHAGPVFQAIDPICGRPNFYGSHINRAARLEPVTVIGHVYATQQFVAVLTAEQSALRSEAQNRGEDFAERFVSEYVGVLSLAKDFGKQTVYHLRRRQWDGEALRDEGLPQAIGAELDLAAIPAEAEPATIVDIGDVGEMPGDDLAAFLDGSEVVDLAADEEPAPSAELPEEDALSSTMLSEDDMAALLSEAVPLDDVDSVSLSDDDMAAFLAGAEVVDLGDDEEPAPCAPVPPPADDMLSSPLLSEDDMALLLSEALPLDDVDSVSLSDDDLAAILADVEVVDLGDDEEPAPCAPAPPPADDMLGSPLLSEDDMAQLLSEAVVADEVDSVSPAGEGALSDDDLAALFAMGDPEDGSDAEAEADEAPRMAVDDPALTSTTLSDDDLASLLAEASEEEEFDAQVAADEEAPRPSFALSEGEEGGEDEGGTHPSAFDPLHPHGPAMTDDEIAALLEESDEEGEATDDIPADVAELPEIGSGPGFSDEDMRAMLAEVIDAAADASDDDDVGEGSGELDADMADVAAAVNAAMAKLETDEEIALAPPRPAPRPAPKPFTGKVEISLAPPRKPG